MEKEKGITFNVDKTNAMKVGKAMEEDSGLKIELKKGVVREV